MLRAAVTTAARAQPDAAPTRHTRGGDAQIGAGADQRLLDTADVIHDQDMLGERHDRVADQLARSVEGDLAAAVHVDDRGASRVGGAFVRVGALAGGEHRRVLEEQDRVRRLARGHRRVDLALQLPGPEVVHGVGAEAGDAEVQGHPVRVPLWMTGTGLPRTGVGLEG